MTPDRNMDWQKGVKNITNCIYVSKKSFLILKFSLKDKLNNIIKYN